MAGALGWLGWLLVREFAAGVIWMGYWAASWGGGHDDRRHRRRDAHLARARFGAELIRFFVGCVKLLAVGYLFSYFWPLRRPLFQLRRDVDATETDEVFLDADATEPSPDLPTITTDQAGRPVVKEKPDAWQPPFQEG